MSHDTVTAAQSTTLYSELSSIVSNLEQAADALGNPRTWTNFKSNPVPGAHVTLTNADFATGTLRITHPGVYTLSEHVTFHPNPGSDFLPTGGQSDYTGFAYKLGFFAALTVEAANVVINLNGKRLKQSKAHSLQQRFFALIELANTPFIPSQGPANFGATIASADKVCIKNGTLGRSSHHGVHGNGAKSVLIENVQFYNFEVAGLHLNGGESIMFRNIFMGNSRKDVPVLGTYSSARFLRQSVAAIIARDRSLALPLSREQGGPKTGTQLLAALNVILDAAFTDAITNGVPVGTSNSDAAIFRNVAGTTDGSVYGIVLNRLGVAVNGFLLDYPETPQKRVVLENICIENLHGTVNEVVAINNPGGGGGSYGGGAQVGPFGDVFQISLVVHPATGVYVQNALANAQLFIALHGNAAEKGSTNITSHIIDWATAGTANINTVVTGDPYYFVYNGDSMHHVMKGLIGVFCSGAENVLFNNVNINNITNTGAAGDTTTAYTTSHSAQSLTGYGGATARGIALASCRNIIVNDVNIQSLSSNFANAVGIDVIGQAASIMIRNNAVSSVASATVAESAAPNPLGYSHTIRMQQSAKGGVVFDEKCTSIIVESA